MKLKNVECLHLFPVAAWLVEYEDFAPVNDAIVSEMARVDWDSEHRRRGLDHEVSRRHGEDVFITLDLVPSVRAIVDAFSYNCNEIARDTGWDLERHEIRVTDFWAHLTPPGRSTQSHHHMPDHLSCAYYVRTPPECGNLRIDDDRKHRILEPDGTPGPTTSTFVEIPAREGRMVIFPSWMSHQVGENRSGEQRISLSMNAALVPHGVPLMPRA